jgi:septal ring factor EnvC (AmiA/AmiB activator)
MWVSFAELRRLRAESHKLEGRIAALETELREERERNRRREDELLNRVLTAAGRYAIETEPKKPEPPKPPAPPKITALDEARLVAYREAAARAGRPPQEADALWKAKLNGVPFTPPYLDESYRAPEQ